MEGSAKFATAATRLGRRPELSRVLDLVRPQATRVFPADMFEAFLAACCDVVEAAGTGAALDYARGAPAAAALVGPAAALEVADTVTELAALAGSDAAGALATAAPAAARHLRAEEVFVAWLQLVRDTAEAAPESIETMLRRTETLLETMSVGELAAWASGGIRAAAGSAERRRAFFALRDPAARRLVLEGEDGSSFAPAQRELRAYLTALWRLAPLVRAAEREAAEPVRRVSFDRGVVTVPPAFRGVAAAEAPLLFRAALAHVGAHLVFGGPKFPIGSLKPLQVALVSLVEDARVESLAMRALPGLRRLWHNFHVAEPSGPLTAPGLLARLARALIDPDFDDPHGWVRKGRAMFLAEEPRWGDPTISRRIGDLLGNDLGQMRVQFNAKTYVVEPLYRDDNHGLWDYGDATPPAEQAETILESVRFEQQDERDAERERDDPRGAAEQAAAAHVAPVEAEIGIPVARYPEWDHAIGRERADWTTILEYEPIESRAGTIDAILERQRPLVEHIENLIGAARVSRPLRLRRQPQGDQLDLDAAIEAVIDRRLGRSPDPRVYARSERRYRDLSVLVLLDVSQSTNDLVPRIVRPILELEREAAAILAHALEKLGDPFALRAFCSDGRGDVRYFRIKDFDASHDGRAKRRLAGLTGRFSTRMGAALRHAGAELERQATYRRLLLVITDGEPSDIDVADRRYLVEDARRAIQGLAQRGIDTFCVGLDAGGDNYLSRIFGRRNALQIDRLEKLPERLSMLYLRLTA